MKRLSCPIKWSIHVTRHSQLLKSSNFIENGPRTGENAPPLVTGHFDHFDPQKRPFWGVPEPNRGRSRPSWGRSGSRFHRLPRFRGRTPRIRWNFWLTGPLYATSRSPMPRNRGFLGHSMAEGGPFRPVSPLGFWRCWVTQGGLLKVAPKSCVWPILMSLMPIFPSCRPPDRPEVPQLWTPTAPESGPQKVTLTGGQGPKPRKNRRK